MAQLVSDDSIIFKQEISDQDWQQFSNVIIIFCGGGGGVRWPRPLRGG